MMLIGALIAAWIVCGTVPMIIYYGLKIISPSVFLLTASIITAIIGIATGSSWSAAGTVGVALMGIGAGLEVNPSMTARGNNFGSISWRQDVAYVRHYKPGSCRI